MSKFVRSCIRVMAMAIVVGGIMNSAGVSLAAPPAPESQNIDGDVPEIDPTSAASALAVLAGGGLMLAERFGFRRR